MNKHTTRWEDGQSVGLECDGTMVDQILSVDHDQPETCSRCGAKIRLIWDVRVEDVPSTPEAKP